MKSAAPVVRRAVEVIVLGICGVYASLSGTMGCGGDMVCIQWSDAEGACPSRADAIKFMAPQCTEHITVESEGDYDGVTCCYDVTKQEFQECPGGTSVAVGSTVVAGPTVASSTSSGTMPCDGEANCPSCQSCAESTNCMSLLSQCFSNSECDALRNCIAQCNQDETCTQQCQTDHPNGVADLSALLQCTTCQECPLDCGCT